MRMVFYFTVDHTHMTLKNIQLPFLLHNFILYYAMQFGVHLPYNNKLGGQHFSPHFSGLSYSLQSEGKGRENKKNIHKKY